MITHDLGVVAEICDDVLVMYGGRVVEKGTVDEIFERPQHPYTWGLLGSMPTIDARLDQLVSIEGAPPSLVNPPSGCAFHPRCRYRFEPCPVDRPELLPLEGGHLDACHLSPDAKRTEWARLRASRTGAAA
jgi:peptide/nickel transport system ATP-binding protein